MGTRLDSMSRLYDLTAGGAKIRIFAAHSRGVHLTATNVINVRALSRSATGVERPTIVAPLIIGSAQTCRVLILSKYRGGTGD